MNDAILIADTDTNVLSTLSQQLRDVGVEVVCAQSNEECMAATFGNKILLAIIDLSFPGMPDGSLCNLLRITCSPDLPIIGMGDANDALSSTAPNTTLVKPVNITALKSHLHTVLNLTTQPDPTEPAPVNMPALMEAAGEQVDFAIELIHLFFSTTSESCKRLQLGISNLDALEISQAAHKCCGSSSACGMDELERRLRRVEAMGLEENLDGVEEATAHMLNELNRCRVFLEQEFGIHIQE